MSLLTSVWDPRLGEEGEKGGNGGFESGESFGGRRQLAIPAERLEFGGGAGERAAAQVRGRALQRMRRAAQRGRVARPDGGPDRREMDGAILEEHRDDLETKPGVAPEPAVERGVVKDQRIGGAHEILRFRVR